MVLRIVFCLEIIMLVSCAKEYSYEGGFSIYAKGSLQDSVNNCMGITVSGNYAKGAVFDSTNYIVVKANITHIGKYKIITDTVNGYYFIDTGTIKNLGLQSFVLHAYGSPLAETAANFTVHFDSSNCHFTVPVGAANYMFNAPTNSCPNIIVNGVYRVWATLNPTDTINVPIKVITPGTYTIQTPLVNGMQFSASGIFLNTGNYTVVLNGSGKPLSRGITKMPLTVRNVNCSFDINAILDTSMYWRCTLEGITYRGLVDSAYNTLSDTGRFVAGNPKRIFTCGILGGDTLFNFTSYSFGISFFQANHVITTGDYLTNNSDFTCGIQMNTNVTPSSYGYYYTNNLSLGNFTIHVTNYNSTTKLIDGTFSGLVYKTTNLNYTSTTPVVQVTNGYFKTYMAY